MRWRDVKQNRVKETKENVKDKIISLEFDFAIIPQKIKAFITDSFLLAMPVFYTVFYLIFGSREGFRDHMLLGWFYILLPLAIITTLFYHYKGQTPGMKAYEIKVIDNKTETNPSFLLSFLRFFFFNISFFSIIGLLISFFRKDKRGLHDLLSGTSVVKAKE